MSACVLLLCSFVLFDAEFVKTLLDLDETAWQNLGETSMPLEQDLKTLTLFSDRLAHWVPQSLLKENLTEIFPPERGDVVLLKGDIVSVTKHDAVYRCEMTLDNGSLVAVFTHTIPEAWKDAGNVFERAAAYGVYVKYSKEAGLPLFAAPAMQWYPDTWLGNLGFNVASLDQVPVSRVIELEHNDEETNRRMFKFTEADREPFYGLLKAVSETPAGWLEEEAKKINDETAQNVTDLFNRPQETRGKPILLHGTAKRIVKTPVTDDEAQKLFGIDHYYQVFFFTEQSRGNPIVICVSSLPEGMPVGDAADFSEAITAAAVPYKLWIYETKEGSHYAPVLIGKSVTWHPKSATQMQVPKSVSTFSFAMFFTLVLLWFACRVWSNPIRK